MRYGSTLTYLLTYPSSPRDDALHVPPIHHQRGRTNFEGVNDEIVVGGEHVEGVVAGVESRLAGGPGERQLREVLQYPRLFVRRRLLDDVVECQRALVRVRVVHVAFRVREVTASLQNSRATLAISSGTQDGSAVTERTCNRRSMSIENLVYSRQDSRTGEQRKAGERKSPKAESLVGAGTSLQKTPSSLFT